MPDVSARSSLGEIARLFLRLGTTSFGGPAAHIAMMELEVVGRRRWLSREQFLDYVSAANLIPGPNSTELAIHIGHARAGWAGLLVAGLCFIVPAALMVGVVAWAYVQYGTLPDAAGLLHGVKPVVIAVVATALWTLGRTAVKSPTLAVLGLVAVVAVAGGTHELAVLAGAGIVMGVGRWMTPGTTPTAAALAGTIAGPGGGVVTVSSVAVGAGAVAASAAASSVGAVTATAVGTTAPFGLTSLFLVFAKVGAVLFGSGYVLLAFLRADLVARLGWLTEAQLVDAIAIGQMMPGPVFTTATFIGFVLGGPAGAAVATAGIFLPAFVFVALSGPLVPRLRQSAVAGAVLDGVNVASLALMAVVSWHLARVALVDQWTVALAAASLFALLRFKVNSVWLIGVGAVVGWMVHG